MKDDIIIPIWNELATLTRGRDKKTAQVVGHYPYNLRCNEEFKRTTAYFFTLSFSTTVMFGCLMAKSIETYCPVLASLACSTYLVLLIKYLLSDFKGYLGLEQAPRPLQKFLFDGYNCYRAVRCTTSDQYCKPSEHVHLLGHPSGGNRWHRSDKPYGWRDCSNSRAKTSSLLVLNNGQSRWRSLHTYYKYHAIMWPPIPLY